MKPHKWQKEIIAWANGAEIQSCYLNSINTPKWEDEYEPNWNTSSDWVYRIKPEPKPDVVRYCYSTKSFGYEESEYLQSIKEDKYIGKANLKVTFDGETGELKSAEVLK